MPFSPKSDLLPQTPHEKKGNPKNSAGLKKPKETSLLRLFPNYSEFKRKVQVVNLDGWNFHLRLSLPNAFWFFLSWHFIWRKFVSGFQSYSGLRLPNLSFILMKLSLVDEKISLKLSFVNVSFCFKPSLMLTVDSTVVKNDHQLSQDSPLTLQLQLQLNGF